MFPLWLIESVEEEGTVQSLMETTNDKSEMDLLRLRLKVL
jgi:hypothetical protein